jgi:hypothetical protein
MPGKLDIYNLASRGVVLDKSDVHTDDGELLAAENWQVDSVGGRGGVRRRDGIRPLNPIPLAGPVLGGVGVPLPDRGALHRVFYLPLTDGGATPWLTSLDGITWTGSTVPALAVTGPTLGVAPGLFNTIGDGAMMWRGFGDKLYYPANDYDNAGPVRPSIHSWDGVDDILIARVPPNPYATAPIGACGVTSILPCSPTQLLVAVVDGNTALPGTGRSRVLLLDLRNGSLTQLGPRTDLTGGFLVAGLALWQGRVWIAGVSGSGGSPLLTYAIRPGDLTWTLDDAYGVPYTPPLVPPSGNNGYCTGLIAFKGELYQGTAADVFTGAVIRKRSNLHVWTVVYASDGIGALNCVGPFAVSADGGTLFAWRHSVSGGAAPAVVILQTTNGTTWSVAFDISALGAGYERSGSPYVDDNGDLYWPLASGAAGATGGLLRRTPAGAWSVVFSANLAVRGPLGIIRTL